MKHKSKILTLICSAVFAIATVTTAIFASAKKTRAEFTEDLVFATIVEVNGRESQDLTQDDTPYVLSNGDEIAVKFYIIQNTTGFDAFQLKLTYNTDVFVMDELEVSDAHFVGEGETYGDTVIYNVALDESYTASCTGLPFITVTFEPFVQTAHNNGLQFDFEFVLPESVEDSEDCYEFYRIDRSQDPAPHEAVSYKIVTGYDKYGNPTPDAGIIRTTEKPRVELKDTTRYYTGYYAVGLTEDVALYDYEDELVEFDDERIYFEWYSLFSTQTCCTVNGGGSWSIVTSNYYTTNNALTLLRVNSEAKYHEGFTYYKRVGTADEPYQLYEWDHYQNRYDSQGRYIGYESVYAYHTYHHYYDEVVKVDNPSYDLQGYLDPNETWYILPSDMYTGGNLPTLYGDAINTKSKSLHPEWVEELYTPLSASSVIEPGVYVYRAKAQRLRLYGKRQAVGKAYVHDPHRRRERWRIRIVEPRRKPG